MSLTAKTRLCAVLGDPVGHSLSPVLHNAWIAAAGLDACYLALRLDAARMDAGLTGLKALQLVGANLTVPLKEAAARLADRRDSAVEALGAANAWRWRADGSVEAFNTDAPGFLAALDEAAPGWEAERVLIAGAGGAARAIAWALSCNGQRRVDLVNRDADRARTVAAELRHAEGHGWAAFASLAGEADLIVNATSLGMVGQPAGDWPLEAARPGTLCVDAVYRPLDTPFLAAARARGLIGLDGLGMLIHQAALAFRLWFDVAPDTAAARRLLLDVLEEKSA